MKKFGCFVLFVILGAIAFLTNPSQEEHVEHAYQALKEDGIDNSGINPDYLVIGEGLLGKDNMSGFLKRFIERKNYYLFSLTEVQFSDEPQIVAIGAFGKLWSINDLKLDVDLKTLKEKVGL